MVHKTVSPCLKHLKHLTALGHEVVQTTPYDVAVIWSVLWHGTMAKNKPAWDNCLQKVNRNCTPSRWNKKRHNMESCN